MQFGQKLIHLRENRGLSQEELADELQVSRQTISNWENDKVSIDVDTAANICRYFGVDMNYLFLDEFTPTMTAKKEHPTSANDDLAISNRTATSSNDAFTTKKQNSVKNSLAIWRTSLVISAILFAVFFTITVIAAALLFSNMNYSEQLTARNAVATISSTSHMSINMILVTIGLVFAGIATLMALAMLIVSSIMYVKCKKSLTEEYDGDKNGKLTDGQQ